MGEKPNVAASPLSNVLNFNSLKNMISKVIVINKIVPITHNDFGPKSISLKRSLSKGAKASSPNNTASISKCTSFAFLAIKITPILNNAGNTNPIAVSFFTKPVF